MGCSASVIPPMTIQPITKADVATDTTDDESFLNPIVMVNPMKDLMEVSTQTDDLQIDLKTNQTASSEENNNTDSTLKYDDLQKISDDRDESVEYTDNQINPRFNQDLDDREELEWILNDMDANQFCINNQNLLSSATKVTPAMVVDAMEKAGDLKNMTKTIWNLLNSARQTGDATYLIRAYTAESSFYKLLNRRLARQSLGNPNDITLEDQIQTIMAGAFAQLGQAISTVQAYQAGQQIQLQNSNEIDWAKLYLQAIYRLILTPNSALRYQGRTYRGMRLTLEQLEQYDKDKMYVCNKAITSTSKLRFVAQNFIDSGSKSENMFDVMFIYEVESFSALLAIDVHTFSLMPSEEEVLIIPGVLYTIGEIKVTSPYSVEIELRSAFQDLANGGFANAMGELFSALKADLD
jgi:hypothetical protein